MPFCLTVGVDGSAMRQIEAFVASFAANHRMTPDDTARVLIVLEELITNLLKYGYPEKVTTGTAEIALSIDDEQLTIELVDDARAFDPTSVPALELDRPAADRPVGGLGLHIVRALTEGMRYSRVEERNVTRLFFRLDSPLRE